MKLISANIINLFDTIYFHFIEHKSSSRSLLGFTKNSYYFRLSILFIKIDLWRGKNFSHEFTGY